MTSWGFHNVTHAIKPLRGPPEEEFDYEADLKRVQRLGERNSTDRSEDQLETGIFWAYDGEARPALVCVSCLDYKLPVCTECSRCDPLLSNLQLTCLGDVCLA